MRDRKLATRYARALLAALEGEPDTAAAVDRFLQALRDALRDSAEFRDLMLDPAVPRAARLGVLQALARERSKPDKVGRFLATVVDHNRAGSLASIAEVFHAEREQALGIVPAVVTTAAPLPDELRSRVQRTLETLTKKKVRLTTEVDASLLGGAVTQVGSMVYDGSLRTQLSRLRRKMTRE